jgi:hypothetical protein
MGQALKGLEIDPEDQTLLLLLGWSMLRLGGTQDVQRAEQIFRPLAEGEDMRAPLGLAQALERQALAHLEAADAIASGQRVVPGLDPAARAAELRAKAGELLDESRTWYQRTLDLQSSNLDALNGMARVEALDGDPARSLEWSQKLLESLVADRTFWEGRLQAAGSGERQEKEIKRILDRLVGLEVAARLHAASVLHELDRDADACTLLDGAIAIQPGRADLHGVRGLVRHALGDWGGAVEDIERYIALSDKSPQSPEMVRAIELRDECAQKRDAAAPAAAKP